MTIWTEPEHDAWAELAKNMEYFVDHVTSRKDIAVIVEPDVRSPEDIAAKPIPGGVFSPMHARININASLVFDADIEADDIEYINVSHPYYQSEFPELIGVLVHESAHAKHSKYLYKSGVEGKVLEWVKVLEETRCEKKIVALFPEYAIHIKTIVRNIVSGGILDDPKKMINDGMSDLMARYQSARMAILICARYDIDVLSSSDIDGVRSKCVSVLGIDDYTLIQNLWLEAHYVDDEDFDSLVVIAEKIQAIVDPNNEAPNQDSSQRMPCGSFSKGESEGGSDGESSQGEGSGEVDENADLTMDIDADEFTDFIQAINDELGKLSEKARKDIDSGLDGKDAVDGPPKKTQIEKDAERRQIIQIQQGQINPAKTSRGYGAGYDRYDPIVTKVNPDATDISRMRSMLNAISEAQFRDVTKTVRPSMIPPGRLKMSEVVQRQAQITAKQTITANPWKQTRRREIDNPPITLAVATDVSYSMSAYQREVSSFSWAVAKAVKTLQGNVGAVAWNAKSHQLIDANRVGEQINYYEARGGSTGCPNAIQALDGLMNLTYGEGVRLLVVLTDGDLPNRPEIQKEIDCMSNAGVIVLWINTMRNGFKPNNATVAYLSDPKDFGRIVGAKMIEALRSA